MLLILILKIYRLYVCKVSSESEEFKYICKLITMPKSEMLLFYASYKILKYEDTRFLLHRKIN